MKVVLQDLIKPQIRLLLGESLRCLWIILKTSKSFTLLMSRWVNCHIKDIYKRYIKEKSFSLNILAVCQSKNSPSAFFTKCGLIWSTSLHPTTGLLFITTSCAHSHHTSLSMFTSVGWTDPKPQYLRIICCWTSPPPLSRGVGCILFEMATGRPMFPGATVKEELHLIFRLMGENSLWIWNSLNEPKSAFQPPSDSAGSERV